MSYCDINNDFKNMNEKFLETFKDNPTPSKKEIFKFLDSHE